MQRESSIETLFEGSYGAVWRYFAEISRIPRPSKHEEKIRRYLIGVAERRGWEIRPDASGNLCFAIPGRGCLVQDPILILQGHVDMVCEKNNDVCHDFSIDPIRLRSDGEWVSAIGTSLGADNGIAVAMMLALASEDLPDRLPLELLLTVDEETGLNGAKQLDASIVEGRHLLNIDNGDDRQLIIACAGGVTLRLHVPKQVEMSRSLQGFTCRISGFQGGHSGSNIRDRANAIRIAAQVLDRLRTHLPEFYLCRISGGDKINAIPRECSFSIAYENSTIACADLSSFIADSFSNLKAGESKATIRIEPETLEFQSHLPLSIIDILRTLPNGVLSMDPHFTSIVQSSISINVVSDADEASDIILHARSSFSVEQEKTVEMVRKITRDHAADFQMEGAYPGWSPNPNSMLLKKGVALYRRCFGRDPEISAIHAGLESGILSRILGTDEVLSFGPTILDPHSPDERVSIASVAKVYDFLRVFICQS